MIETNGTQVKPRITRFVWAGGQKMRRNSKMRGTWGHDAACSCGWESRTGGATETSVKRAVADHLWFEHGILRIVR